MMNSQTSFSDLASVKMILVLLYVILLIGEIQCQAYRDKIQNDDLRDCNHRFHCFNEQQCISEENVCDGKKHCADGSDESTVTCSRNICPDFAFRCNYGACIDRDYKCDGTRDCADNSDETHSDCMVAPTCSTLQFTCKSGECISTDLVCDGVAHCSDSSDETEAECKTMRCHQLQYRCAYGACVDRDALCNGMSECVDNSDEDPRICSLLPQRHDELEEHCVLPLYPANGFYKFERKHPGEKVKPGSIIFFQCNVGFQLRPIISQLIYCQNDTWNADPPECIAECERLQSISQEIRYFNGSFEVKPEEPILPNTVATLKCKHSYLKPDGPVREQLYCNEKGSWNGYVYECQAVCGTEIGNARPFVINGSDANPLEYPWNVGIYETNTNKDHIHICGGTIISARLVLTAAHCFFLESKRKTSKFAVAAGKYYSDWFATELNGKDPHSQLREITPTNINIPEEYLGSETSFRSDIALLILERKDHFVFNDFVRPACVDWNNLWEQEVLKKNSVGKVAGWGKTSENVTTSSETLRTIDVPYRSFNECIAGIPSFFKPFVIGDKICTGYLNGSSVCEGDSGSGLVFKNPVDKLYYIRGIVSIGPSKKTPLGYVCNSQAYTLYTRISNYIHWIRQHDAKTS